MAIAADANPMNITRLFSVSKKNGFVSVPVSPRVMVYTQFDHVKGVPTSGSQGVSVSRVAILNRLLKQLHRLQRQAGIKEQNNQTTHFNENNIEENIQRVSAEIKERMERTKPFHVSFDKGELIDLRR